jgi:hypothetical protein
VTAALTVPAGGQLVWVGGTGAVVMVGVGVGLELGSGVLEGLTVDVGLPVGDGFTPVSPHAASKKMSKQPSSAKMQREKRFVFIIPSILALQAFHPRLKNNICVTNFSYLSHVMDGIRQKRALGKVIFHKIGAIAHLPCAFHHHL